MTESIFTDEQMQEFQMPAISVGDYVVWYDNGIVTPHAPLALVVDALSRLISVRLLSGTTHESVRHASDPKLTVNKFHRQNGAWDYTPARKEAAAASQATAELMAGLERRVAALEYKFQLAAKRRESLSKARDQIKRNKAKQELASA